MKYEQTFFSSFFFFFPFLLRKYKKVFHGWKDFTKGCKENQAESKDKNDIKANFTYNIDNSINVKDILGTYNRNLS